MGVQELKVVAALIKKGEKLLLCQRKEEDSFGLLWEFPGGTIQEGETQKEALIREIREEIGLEIEPGELKEVFTDVAPSLRIKVFLYEVRNFRGRPQCLDCQDLSFFSKEEIKKLNLAPVDRKIFEYITAFLN